jgi:hypothetical protein
MTKLLLDEHPMLVLPSLAVRLGVEGALMLQQIHYWCLRSPERDDGQRWVYNTVRQWAEHFPFWSERTVRRILSELKASGVLLVEEFNAARGDRTPFYAINYQALEGTPPSAQSRGPSGQNARMVRPKRADHPRNLAASIEGTETTTETTTEIQKPLALSPAVSPPQQQTPATYPDGQLILLPCTGGKEWPLSAESLREMRDLYPGVDLFAEIRKARGWLIGNPTKRKTERGMLRFLHNWLAKAQDRGGSTHAHHRTPPAGGLSVGDRIRARAEANDRGFDEHWFGRTLEHQP